MTKQPAMFPRKALTPALAASFAAFWAAYPRRSPNPRAVAAVAFLGAVKSGADPAQLGAAAGAYAAEVKAKGIEEKFVVHASTFLRQQRFLDYQPEPGAAARAPAAEPDHPLWPKLQGHLSAAVFQAWIGKCQVLELTSSHLILRAPSSFVASRMREEFLPLLRRALGGDGPFQIVLQLPEAP